MKKISLVSDNDNGFNKYYVPYIVKHKEDGWPILITKYDGGNTFCGVTLAGPNKGFYFENFGPFKEFEPYHEDVILRNGEI